MNRRTLITALAAICLAPRLAHTQQARRIVWFGVETPDTVLPYLDELRASLRELGWEESRNLSIQRVSSVRAPDDFEEIARQVIAAQPEVVVSQEFASLAMLR